LSFYYYEFKVHTLTHTQTIREIPIKGASSAAEAAAATAANKRDEQRKYMHKYK